MFIAIINFPIKQGRDEEFREWFARTNKEFAGHEGLLNRRLLKPLDGDNYFIMIEHESFETFKAGHSNPVHEKADKLVAPLLDGNPTPQFYEVIVG